MKNSTATPLSTATSPAHAPTTLTDPTIREQRIDTIAPAANDTALGREGTALDAQPANEAPDPRNYLAFVRRIASRIARNLPDHVPFDDLVGAGTLGLLDALERFDPARCARFETFAEFRVKGAILDELRRYDLMARNARLTSKRIARVAQELTAKFGAPPSEDQIATALDLTVEQFRELQRKIGHVRVLSIDEGSGDDDGPHRGVELESHTIGPDEYTLQREMVDRLNEAVLALPSRQQAVVEMYFRQELTLKEIGRRMGVTESRVCQIISETTGRLKNIIGASPMQ